MYKSLHSVGRGAIAIAAMLVGMAAAVVMSLPAAAAPVLTANVSEGELSGVRQGDIGAYLGIPYAAPPVGALRWRAPEPAAPWKGVRQAKAFGNSCTQIIDAKGGQPWTWEYGAQDTASEDCLYLNVWTPAQAKTDKLPVLFWIYGGGFMVGSGSVPIYDGAHLAAKGIVVVSINYRLGALGFLSHPGLSAESPHHVSGNYGVLDTIAALRWVKKNIAAFGGDPNRVTIYGQSAGSGMVIDLTFIPEAKGLFAGAIAQSGVGTIFPMPDMKAAEQNGLDFAKAMGVKTLDELRALPAEKLLKLPPMTGDFWKRGPMFAPIMDGWLLPKQQSELTAEGKVNDTPFLTGMTADETSSMNPKYGSMTAQDCDAAFAKLTGPLAEKFKAAYLKGPDCNDGYKALMRDRGQASTYAWVEKRLKAGRGPVYVYFYQHVEPGTDPVRYGAFHSSDLPYVFQTLDKTPERPFTDKDRRISQQISDYWVNFVKTGNPNGKGLPVWPAADPVGQPLMQTGDDLHARPALEPVKRQLMQDLVSQGGTVGMF